MHEQFGELADLAMKRALDIMRLPPNPKNEKLLTIQAQIIGNVFTTTARTDPTKLKGVASDRVGEVLERIRAEQAEE
jgi:hypothetical protein